MDGHFGNDTASSVGRATSRPIIPRAKSATDGISFTAVGNDTNDCLGNNDASLTRPRSEKSASSIDWSSLNGMESIVLDRAENGSVSAASHATTLQPGG